MLFIYNYIKKIISKLCSCKKPDTRFYYLSLMENIHAENGYTIHGLWPQYNSNSYPEFCKIVQFSMSDITTLKKDLEIYWKPPNMKDPMKLWRHEWKKHGSCIFTDVTQYEYFKITLDLYKEVIDKNIMCDKYKTGTHILIPVGLNFELLI